MLRIRRPPRYVTNTSPLICSYGLPSNTTADTKAWSIMRSADGFPQFRFETRLGDAWSGDYPDNPAIRSEIAPQAGNWLVYGVDHWVSFWQRLTCPIDPTRTGVSAHLIPAQLHGGYPDRAPIFSQNVREDGFLEHRIIEQTSAQAWGYSTKFADAVGNDGNWHHYVMRLRPHANGDGTGSGQLQTWRDGVELLNLTNLAFGYLGDPPPYWKYGMYIKPPTAAATNVVEVASFIGPVSNSLVGLVSSPQAHRA